MATLVAEGGISEATLGSPPFALFLNSAGHASMATAAAGATPAPAAAEPACPSSGEWSLTFSDGRTTARATRLLPCAKAIGGSPE
jgi:hypothetical protein